MILGTVVVAIAAVAIVFMLTNDKDDGGATSTLPVSSSVTQVPGVVSSTSSTSSTSSSVTSSSVPAAAPALEPGPVTVSYASWEMITGGALGGDGGQSLSDIAAIGDGYVAVGISGDAVVWTSADGVAWTAQPAPGLAGAQLLHVESAPDGTLVGVGRTLTTPPAFAAWTSTDGVTWTPQATENGALPAGVQQVSDLAAYSGGYVAVGLVNNDGDIDAAWWTSPDGVTWTADTIAEPGVQQMLGVAVSDGVMVAAGENRPNTGIWRGPVGGVFAPVDHVELTTSVSDFDPAYPDARVFAWDIAAGGPGFVAVGADQTTAGTSAAAVWTSQNGEQWNRFGNETEYTPNMLHANFAGHPPWTVMDTITESNGTLIVVGRTGPPTDPDLAIWESVDGVTWRQGAVGIIPGRQYAANALARNGRLIVVGEQGAFAAGDGAVWVATPDLDAPQTGTWREVPTIASGMDGEIRDAIAIDDRIIAVGALDETLAMWESPNGTDWSPVPVPAFYLSPRASLDAILSFDGVLVAAGTDLLPVILWSTDASTWEVATTPDVGTGGIDGIWQGQGQLFAYGSSGSGTPLIWVSSDGLNWRDTDAARTLGLTPRVMGIAGFAGQIVLAAFDPTIDGIALWTSPDGGVWTRTPDPPALAGFLASDFTTFSDRLVIAGRVFIAGRVPASDAFATAVLVTRDLQAWDLIILDPASQPLSPWIQGISVVGSQLIMSGSVTRTRTVPALWSTGDLDFWTLSEPLPIAGGVNDQLAVRGTINTVVPIGDRLVGVGFGYRDDFTMFPSAWISDR